MPVKNQKGFTLIEVILSIGVLALLSGFILQFFLASNRLNDRSGQVDQANVLAVTVMEAFKAQPVPAIGADTDPLLALSQPEGEGIVAWYDADWQPAAQGNTAAFVLYAQLSAQSERSTMDTGDGVEYGELVQLSVRVETLTPSGTGLLSDPLLVENAVMRYFVWKEAGA